MTLYTADIVDLEDFGVLQEHHLGFIAQLRGSTDT